MVSTSFICCWNSHYKEESHLKFSQAEENIKVFLVRDFQQVSESNDSLGQTGSCGYDEKEMDSRYTLKVEVNNS